VKATEKAFFCLNDHVELKGSIISLGRVTKVIEKQAIPKKMFKYLTDY